MKNHISPTNFVSGENDSRQFFQFQVSAFTFDEHTDPGSSSGPFISK